MPDAPPAQRPVRRPLSGMAKPPCRIRRLSPPPGPPRPVRGPRETAPTRSSRCAKSTKGRAPMLGTVNSPTVALAAWLHGSSAASETPPLQRRGSGRGQKGKLDRATAAPVHWHEAHPARLNRAIRSRSVERVRPAPPAAPIRAMATTGRGVRTAVDRKPGPRRPGGRHRPRANARGGRQPAGKARPWRPRWKAAVHRRTAGAAVPPDARVGRPRPPQAPQPAASGDAGGNECLRAGPDRLRPGCLRDREVRGLAGSRRRWPTRSRR